MQLAERFEGVRVNDQVDERFGFAHVQEASQREGWLENHLVRIICNIIHGRADVC
jgi:hypothetical protein